MSSHGWLWNVTKQLRLSSTDQEISLFRSSLLQEVLIGSVILQLPVALPLPCQRRAAPHPKKGETSSQGRASLTRPVLSRAGLLNKDQTQRVCTSPGLLYNRPLCHRARAVRTQLRGEASLTYCTQPCLQRAFTALHISSLMDDDDWARALMPVYITVGHTHTHTLHSWMTQLYLGNVIITARTSFFLVPLVCLSAGSHTRRHFPYFLSKCHMDLVVFFYWDSGE